MECFNMYEHIFDIYTIENHFQGSDFQVVSSRFKSYKLIINFIHHEILNWSYHNIWNWIARKIYTFIIRNTIKIVRNNIEILL